MRLEEPFDPAGDSIETLLVAVVPRYEGYSGQADEAAEEEAAYSAVPPVAPFFLILATIEAVEQVAIVSRMYFRLGLERRVTWFCGASLTGVLGAIELLFVDGDEFSG